MKNITIVGFMGTGKTVVAKALARDLGMKYVSTDDLIEAREKKPIKDIFKDQGEPYFRKVEKEVVGQIGEKADQVIDAGGGVVLDEKNIENLRKNGVIICLWADLDTIYERTVKHGHRPLLNVEDPKKRIEELMEYRSPFYEKADIHINTADLDVNGVVKLIKGLMADEKEDERKES